MTIRRDRNRAARREIVNLYAERLRCPDCRSDAEMVEHARDVFELVVHHDATCPQWQAMGRPA